MGVVINAPGVKQAVEDFMDSMAEIGFDGVKSDLTGGEGTKHDDPRAAQLLGSWQNCRTMDSMNEISAFMNRLWPQIQRLRPGEKKQRAELYFRRTVDNLKRCVRQTA